ncbi:zeta toxin family protein [Chitinophaga arvensicola]|nr:zeta toxin family protein [Chitinophaga arvensicola]
MPNLYIIAGCNGAGKTTASFTLLPGILDCKEFVNADIIAAGLSPFNPGSMALPAGRLMLKRIKELMQAKVDFAFETTLATRSYVSLIEKAKAIGYTVSLLFFWLDSPEMAQQRVSQRVQQGGHHIPHEVIRRRYSRGLHNLMHLYTSLCDHWMIVDNRNTQPREIMLGTGEHTGDVWEALPQHADTQLWKTTQDHALGTLSRKIMHGLKIAMQQLVETNAARNQQLVIGDQEGHISRIAASDLLHTVR